MIKNKFLEKKSILIRFFIIFSSLTLFIPLLISFGKRSFISFDEGYYILSKGPFASCFFCGDGGPETIVELELKNKNQYFMMDEIATIKGVLKLNADDIYQCVYILQNAEVSR